MGYWQKEEDEYFIKGGSFLGEFDWQKMTQEEITDRANTMEVFASFMKDNNLVEMAICSACMGFSYTFQKRPIRAPKGRDKE